MDEVMLQQVLTINRLTPNPNTSSAELMFARKIKTVFDKAEETKLTQYQIYYKIFQNMVIVFFIQELQGGNGKLKR